MVKLTQIFFCGDCQVYKNPYNHGKMNNWKLFLGVEKRRCVFFFGLVYFSKSLFMLECDFSAITAFQSLGYACYSSLRTFSTW